MAKYRRPVLPADNTYETASTIPAAASFQDVPPPSEETKGVRKAIPIPAMVTMDEIKDTSREAKEKGGEKEKEIIVQGGSDTSQAPSAKRRWYVYWLFSFSLLSSTRGHRC